MAGDHRDPGAPEPELPDGSGLRVVVVCSRFNDRITRRLLDGASAELARLGVAADAVAEVWVPGAFELPLAAHAAAQRDDTDAVVALGCVIRGETAHFDYVAGGASAGIMQVALETGVPVVFGVLTTEDLPQALARSEVGGDDKGAEAARVAVEMAAVLARLGDPRPLT